jgi:hypothetical protein
MAKTAFVDFKAVKAAITMEQVLQHYGLLEKFKRGTDSLNGPCPIHKGSNPTQFRVSLKTSGTVSVSANTAAMFSTSSRRWRT